MSNSKSAQPHLPSHSEEFVELGKSAGMTVVVCGHQSGGDYGIPTVELCGCLDYLGCMTPETAEQFAMKLLRAAAAARGQAVTAQ